ncbi:MAG: E-cinnamoyl-CoA:R-phenyllactate CoA transferase [Syntrophorhabdaceae bacterium PtaU1.Bin034]|nr:MAG: E-cinnamoyl-CoA:R-phenyllactate CoA transferase [Syntrophorhabdaceae bacterium PtaU1.Bin034]
MDIFRNMTMLSLEQATVLPYLSYRLAMDGIRVIRLEHPVYGDPNRMIGENRLGEERMNTYFMAINAGKKAVTLNLGSPRGQELLKELLVKLKVDIFATNQLPRNYEKLGIDYETLKAVKPNLVWVGLTGFGPESNEAAYDPILQARGGLMELTGNAGEDPQVLGIPLPDMGTSEHAYGLVMKALCKGAMTGEGERIDVSMFMSTTSWLTVAATLTKSFGNKITRRGNTHEFFAPVSVYETKDGYVYLAVGNDRQWSSFTQLPGFEKLVRPEYEKNKGRISDVTNLNRQINECTKTKKTDEMIEMCNKATIAISRVNTIEEVLEDPYVKKALLTSTDPVTKTKIWMAPPPFMTSFLKESGQQMTFPPRFGEHNSEIYSSILGYTEAQLKEFREKEVI